MKAVLRGIGASEGKARGRVKVVRYAQDEAGFREGDVLVACITDPTMVLMMNRASAIVCDVGGMTSHPSILSRELGIPCVVAAKDATRKLKDGDEVVVDGSSGEVFMD